jgi:hypothetical protein
VGTDEEGGVVKRSGIKASESRMAFERSGAGSFGLGVGFGVAKAGSATVEVETGMGCTVESRWLFEESDVIGMRRGTSGVGDEGSAPDGRGAGRDEGTPVGVVGWEAT